MLAGSGAEPQPQNVDVLCCMDILCCIWIVVITVRLPLLNKELLLTYLLCTTFWTTVAFGAVFI